MRRMNRTGMNEAVQASRLSDVLSPRTLWHSVALFSLGYLIWQPVAHLGLMHWLIGQPLAFNTTAEWARFALTACAVGAVVGAAYYRVQGMEQGWWREWADNALRLTAMGMILQAATFQHSIIEGLLVVALVAVIVAAFLAGTISFFTSRSRS